MNSQPSTDFAARPATRDCEAFHRDVMEGLSQRPKRLPCKYFYDRRGSVLFDAICELDEYYLTRTESQIMEQHVGEMGQQIGEGVMLVEYGSGSSAKTRHLLDALPRPAVYVPVDISCQHLLQTARGLARDYPELEVAPVCADFTQPFELPPSVSSATHAAVYFPGSTIGNFESSDAKRLLSRITTLCGEGGGLLIGIDLKKDPRVIEAAYNDSQQVTDEFNLNLLHRMNRELDGDFQLDQFQHQAVYDSEMDRVEISLVSRRAQTARVGGRVFTFQDGEAMHTEYSHKYTIDGFAELAADVGLTLRRSWTDDRDYFAVLHLAVLD